MIRSTNPGFRTNPGNSDYPGLITRLVISRVYIMSSIHITVFIDIYTRHACKIKFRFLQTRLQYNFLPTRVYRLGKLCLLIIVGNSYSDNESFYGDSFFFCYIQFSVSPSLTSLSLLVVKKCSQNVEALCVLGILLYICITINDTAVQRRSCPLYRVMNMILSLSSYISAGPPAYYMDNKKMYIFIK
jgi:hypothetical protein